MKRFLKFTDWKPEGSHSLSVVQLSILKGTQPEAVVHHQYLLEAKQHSQDYLYVSSEHPSKWATIFFYRAPSEDSSTHQRFGIIKKIFKRSFAKKEFVGNSEVLQRAKV